MNSKAKGKRGELAAAKYLQSLGFESARRGQQYSGIEGDDVVCEELDNVHLEVKYGYDVRAFDQELDRYEKAIEQAIRDAGARSWAVLWKPHRYVHWRLSFEGHPCRCTVTGDERIKRALQWLQEGA